MPVFEVNQEKDKPAIMHIQHFLKTIVTVKLYQIGPSSPSVNLAE
jgi:hypothetical protein